ncbi:MAG TPA: YeeE/YedE family protein, partial [Minicystis sp.]|nr:YeeE/YedE family protein [Minicystis sp.]
GAAASLLLLANGRVAGVSGILGRALVPTEGERAWRVTFVAGLVAGGLLLRLVAPARVAVEGFGLGTAVVAGLLVGVGTRLGNGCTSGHGICGLARRSPRSIVATGVFMAAGMATVFVVRHVVGAAP